MRILIVDDHADSAAATRMILRLDGHDVEVAADLAGAAAAVARSCPDLLIADLSLPDGTGWDLFERLKRAHPGLPAIALSGRAYARDVDRSRELGFCEHLSKPVDMDALRATVRRCFAGQSDPN
ncbi:MAG TPA: response regulator [Humisphaera sp.]